MQEGTGAESGQQSKETQTRFFLAGLVLAAAIFLVDIQIPLGVAAGVPYIAVVLLAQWHGLRRTILYAALLGSLLTVLGFFLSPPGGEPWKVLSNRALSLFAIWVTAMLTLQRRVMEEKRELAVRQREEALAQVKILRGFLPICALCKKIRDDRGYWKQIESYIRDHSEAEFSHSICPECAERLYPEFSGTEKKGREAGEKAYGKKDEGE